MDYIELQKEVFQELQHPDEGWEINFPLGVVFRGYAEKWVSQYMPITFTSLNPLQAQEYSDRIICIEPNVTNTIDLRPLISDDEVDQQYGGDYGIYIEDLAIKLANESKFDSAFVETEGNMPGPELILFEPEKAKVIGHLEINWGEMILSII
jgi:hypothetical protein